MWTSWRYMHQKTPHSSKKAALLFCSAGQHENVKQGEWHLKKSESIMTIDFMTDFESV